MRIVSSDWLKVQRGRRPQTAILRKLLAAQRNEKSVPVSNALKNQAKGREVLEIAWRRYARHT
jgi:hypothetical protein